METKKDYIWVDELKGIGILLVVLGHSINYVESSVGDVGVIADIINFWIYSFHMPLFFVISGFLQRNSEMNKTDCYSREKIINKMIDMGIPYLFFSFIFWLSKIVMSDNVNNKIGIKELLLVWINPLSSLWFIYLLLVFYLLRVFIFKKNISNKIIIISSFILCISSYYITVPVVLQGTVLFRFMRFSLYYGIGISLYDHYENFVNIAIRKMRLLISILLIASAVLIGISYFVDSFSLVMVVLCMLELWLLFVCAINQKNVTILGSIWGKSSLGIYLLHDYFVCLIVIIFKKLSVVGGNSGVWLCILLTFLIASLCSLILYKIMNRFFGGGWIFHPTKIFKKKQATN